MTAGALHPNLLAQVRAHRAVGRAFGGKVRWDFGLSALRGLDPDIHELCVCYFHHQRDHPQTVRVLADYVFRGGAFLALHGVSASFKGNASFERLLGGVFTGHSVVERLQLIRTVPETNGLALDRHVCPAGDASGPLMPEVIDEPYEHRIGAEVTVLCSWQKAGDDVSRSPEPCAWTRTHGAGRVAYLALGHRAAVWNSPEVLSILGDLVQWCTASEGL